MMSVTQIDLDDDALAEAMRLAGARSKKETVNLALHEYAARHQRIAAIEQHAAATQGWDYEGWLAMRLAPSAPRNTLLESPIAAHMVNPGEVSIPPGPLCHPIAHADGV
jgi:Arc/MetJ family transcription regulator